MSKLTQNDIKNSLVFLLDSDFKDRLDLFIQQVSVARIPQGQFVCWEGDVCGQLAIVLSGTVRVFKTGENGREITLYRIEKNDSCVLTASCILSQSAFPAQAIVEEDVRAVLIPANTLKSWVKHYDIWRNYVFSLMSKRLAAVISTVEEIAFGRVDQRICNFLLTQTLGDNRLHITHQEIAFELGSAREVVSRILKDYEKKNIIQLSRGLVTITDRKALQEQTKNL